MIFQVRPVVDGCVRNLCAKPYPGHKTGCPNYGKKAGCPPQAPIYWTVYDLSKPVYAIINEFDLRGHVERMRAAHPEWSHRQLVCCLYWQSTARKQLMAKIKEFLREHPGYSVEACPEAMGVDVTQTLGNEGFKLEWPPEKWACQVALAGIKKRGDVL